jgi:hypothetical protein
MSTSDQNHSDRSRDEQLFIQRALASVEKAEKFQMIRQVATTIFLAAFAFWFAFRPTSPEMKIESTVMIFVGLTAAVCTSKILGRINKNTKDILQAISARR